MPKSTRWQRRRTPIQVDPSLRALHAYLDELFFKATAQGEIQLLHRIFSV
jgi:hypothetical protein